MKRKSVLFFLFLVLGLIGTVSAQTEGLHYSFNNTIKPAPDLSGNGNNGLVNGDLPLVVSGKWGDAWSFDGSGDYVKADGSNNVPDNSAFTLSAWVKFDGSYNNNNNIIAKQSSSTSQGYQIKVRDNDGTLEPALTILTDSGGGDLNSGVPVSNLQDGNYHHIVAWHNPENGSSKIYIDNTLENSGSPFGSGDFSTTADLTVGSRSNGDNPIEADIDEPRVYSGILNESQIDSLYNSGSLNDSSDGGDDGSSDFDIPNPILGYHFNTSSTSDHAIDISGNGYEGVIGSGVNVGFDGIPFNEGLAFDFSGNTDSVNTTYKLTGTDTPFAYTAWIKPGNVSDSSNDLPQPIIAGDSRRYSLGVYEDNLRLMGYDGSNTQSVEANDVIDKDEWQFVAVSYDGSTATLYKNSTSVTSGPYTNVDNDKWLFIGNTLDYSDRIFEGGIDEPRVYGEYLNSSEISSIYENQKTKAKIKFDSASITPENPDLLSSIDLSATVTTNNSIESCYTEVSRNNNLYENVSLNIGSGSCSKNDSFSVDKYGEYSIEFVVEDNESNSNSLSKSLSVDAPETSVSGVSGASKFDTSLSDITIPMRSGSAFSDNWPSIWDNASHVWFAGDNSYDSFFYWDSATGSWSTRYRDSEYQEYMIGNFNFMSWFIDKYSRISNVISTEPTSKGLWREGRSQPPFYISTGERVFESTNRTDIACQTYKYGRIEMLDFWRNQNVGELEGMEYNRPRYNPDSNLYHYDSGTGTGDDRNQRASFESGRDVTPIWDTPTENVYQIETVGLNALQYYNYNTLADLGETCRDRTSKSISDSELENLRDNASSIKSAMDERFWDDEDDWYYNYDRDQGSQIKKKTLADAVVLYSGMLNESRSKKVADTLKEDFFDGYVSPPSINQSYSNPSWSGSTNYLWQEDSSMPPWKILVYDGLSDSDLAGYEDFDNYFSNMAVGQEYVDPLTGGAGSSSASEMTWGYSTIVTPMVQQVFGLEWDSSENLIKVAPVEPPKDGASLTVNLGDIDHLNASFSKGSENVSYTLSSIKSHNVSVLLYFNSSYSLNSPNVYRDGSLMSDNRYSLESVDSDSDLEAVRLNSSIGSSHTFTLEQSDADTTAPSLSIDSPGDGVTYNESEVDLNVTSDEAVDTLEYSLDGGANQTFTPNTTLSGLSDGGHTVDVYATDSAGNIGSASTSFTVDTSPTDNPPSVSVSLNDTQIYVNESVDASVSATDDFQVDSVSLDWTGDGTFEESSSGSSLTASRNFSLSGIYSVTAQAIDNNSQTDSSSVSLDVQKNVTVTNKSIIESCSNVSSSSVFCHDNRSKKEVINGGFTSEDSVRLNSTVNANGVEGNFTVFGFANSTGTHNRLVESGKVDVEVAASSSGNSAPTPDFSISPSSPVAGESITFDASSSSDSDGSITNYQWDWTGDGTFDASGETSTHTYPSSGDYTVKLKTVDDDGASGTLTSTVTVASEDDSGGGGSGGGGGDDDGGIGDNTTTGGTASLGNSEAELLTPHLGARYGDGAARVGEGNSTIVSISGKEVQLQVNSISSTSEADVTVGGEKYEASEGQRIALKGIGDVFVADIIDSSERSYVVFTSNIFQPYDKQGLTTEAAFDYNYSVESGVNVAVQYREFDRGESESWKNLSKTMFNSSVSGIQENTLQKSSAGILEARLLLYNGTANESTKPVGFFMGNVPGIEILRPENNKVIPKPAGPSKLELPLDFRFENKDNVSVNASSYYLGPKGDRYVGDLNEAEVLSGDQIGFIRQSIRDFVDNVFLLGPFVDFLEYKPTTTLIQNSTVPVNATAGESKGYVNVSSSEGGFNASSVPVTVTVEKFNTFNDSELEEYAGKRDQDLKYSVATSNKTNKSIAENSSTRYFQSQLIMFEPDPGQEITGKLDSLSVDLEFDFIINATGAVNKSLIVESPNASDKEIKLSPLQSQYNVELNASDYGGAWSEGNYSVRGEVYYKNGSVMDTVENESYTFTINEEITDYRKCPDKGFYAAVICITNPNNYGQDVQYASAGVLIILFAFAAKIIPILGTRGFYGTILGTVMLTAGLGWINQLLGATAFILCLLWAGRWISDQVVG